MDDLPSSTYSSLSENLRAYLRAQLFSPLSIITQRSVLQNVLFSFVFVMSFHVIITITEEGGGGGGGGSGPSQLRTSKTEVFF